MRGIAGDKGFTLMEVVVAVTIMGLVMATLGTAFSQLSNGAHRLEESGDDNLALGEAIRWMGRDLEGLYVDQAPLFSPGDSTDEPDPYRFTLARETVGGEEVSVLRFTTLNHLPFGESSLGGIAEVVYFITEEKGELRLRRSDRLFFHDPFEPASGHPVMMTRVTAFQVVCLDAEGQEQETWDSDSDTYGRATPVAVKVSLSREGASGRSAEALFPLRSLRKEAVDG
ncbi:PulJ/GspJ family protein [Desulfoluna spongiiphila]|uniref:Prepilin-type N-terminal cleavage/methylation domain-containing protein n=1 Tax=Desulfoluna spongiiphila TaxID=419481 RepID=A0A1G5J4K8_9BACT|nr:type II secretion system protein [Desulfoluna spongiiphila]SCY82618.1 prepilin-type N-terminal cleavage/methylation domain-containing protein [Desulfoluna spongiiphila]